MKKGLIVFIAVFFTIIVQAQSLQQLQGKWNLTKMKTSDILVEPSKSDSLVRAWYEEYKLAILKDGGEVTEEDSVASVEDSKSLLKSIASLSYTFSAKNVIIMDLYSETEEKMVKEKGTYSYNATTKLLNIRTKTKAGKIESKKYKVKVTKSSLTLSYEEEGIILYFKKA